MTEPTGTETGGTGPIGTGPIRLEKGGTGPIGTETGGTETGGGGPWSTPEQPGGGPSSWSSPPGSGAAAPAAGVPAAGGPLSTQKGWGQYSGPQAPRYGSVVTRRGIIALKPLGVGDFFDGSFRAIRHNPRVMVGLTALLVGVSSLLVALPLTGMLSTIDFTATEPSNEDLLSMAGLLGAVVPAALLQTVVLIVLTGLLILSVSQSVVDRRLSMAELWRRAKGRVWTLIGWSLLQTVVGSLLLLVALAPGIALFVAEEVVGGVVALLVLLLGAGVLTAWLVTVLSLVPALIVIERLGILASVRRSFLLIRGAFWRTFLVLFLAGMLTSFVSNALAFPFSIIGAALGALVVSTNETLFLAINVVTSVIGGSAGAIIALPFFSAVVALLYIDRRIRLEGLDVALGRTMSETPQ